MDVSTTIRKKYFDKISALKFNGKSIPVFDEFVNPSGAVLSDSGAEIYVILQGQQEYDNALQNICDYKVDADITVKVVTKFKINGSKKLCEDIGDLIDKTIRTNRTQNTIGIYHVKLSLSKTIPEISGTGSGTSFQKILTYTNTLSK